MKLEEELAQLERGVVEVLPAGGLKEKLERARGEKRPLRVKLGVDPTAPDIHLGHTVVLRKLRQFQDLGHQAVLIIGDYTALIGDPSGRDRTRPQLTPEDIAANRRTYEEQAAKILDRGKLEMVSNGDWFRGMSFMEVIRLTSRTTVARMLERDDFSRRYREQTPISIHEFLYPLMQAHDSVVVRADVELGATDQTFNILLGRELQKEDGQEVQVGLTLPMLPGTDGEKKMSKSLGNYIGIDEAAGDIFGKAMSVPDVLMVQYFELVTDLGHDEVKEVEKGLSDGSLHPGETKRRLARTLARMYHGEEAAAKAEAVFDAKHKSSAGMTTRERLEVIKPEEKEVPASELKEGRIWICKLIKTVGFAASNGAARRLVTQGAVELEGEKVSDCDLEVELPAGKALILKVGKRRYARIRRTGGK